MCGSGAECGLFINIIFIYTRQLAAPYASQVRQSCCAGCSLLALCKRATQTALEFYLIHFSFLFCFFLFCFEIRRKTAKNVKEIGWKWSYDAHTAWQLLMHISYGNIKNRNKFMERTKTLPTFRSLGRTPSVACYLRNIYQTCRRRDRQKIVSQISAKR